MSKTSAYIKLILADDHQFFCDGVAMMLNSQPEFEVLAQASNGKELLDLADQFKPDIIITDITMPIMGGIEAARQIVKKYPDSGIIALSMFDENHLIVEMLESGARGYLLKNAEKSEIIDAVKTVYKQQPYYCKRTTVKLASMIASSTFNPYRTSLKPEFTEREIEVIQLICQELTNKEIADKLYLSARTVEGHRQKILEKMDVKNTVGLVIYAIRIGLFKVK